MNQPKPPVLKGPTKEEAVEDIKKFIDRLAKVQAEPSKENINAFRKLLDELDKKLTVSKNTDKQYWNAIRERREALGITEPLTKYGYEVISAAEKGLAKPEIKPEIKKEELITKPTVEVVAPVEKPFTYDECVSWLNSLIKESTGSEKKELELLLKFIKDNKNMYYKFEPYLEEFKKSEIFTAYEIARVRIDLEKKKELTIKEIIRRLKK